MIWKWDETVTEFNMAATNIGMIQQGYQASVKVDGCPMMSPTEQTFIDGERKSKSHSFVQKLIECFCIPYYNKTAFHSHSSKC